jgi:hypothetical protein
MPIQTSGQISLSDIASEIPTIVGDISLFTLSTANINLSSPSKPDGSTPHAMSEFYGYDHYYNPGTLWIGSSLVDARSGGWDLLCGAPLYLTYSLNTPSPLIGTRVQNSDGTALSVLPSYVALDPTAVAELDGAGIITQFFSCSNVGDPLKPKEGGIGLTPAPGETIDDNDPFGGF